jgi:L-ascorbate metabolism protein UlaG (beta-lactamase superfamily)
MIRLKKAIKMILLYTLGFIVLSAIGVVAYINIYPGFGASSNGKRLERMEASPNYSDGSFQNTLETTMSHPDRSIFTAMKKFFFGDENRTPKSDIPIVKTDLSLHKSNDTGLVITWLGHSSVLINIEGKTILTDPVFSERPSPVPFIGPKQFNKELPLSIKDMPEIDIVLISHDHYDHLDYGAIPKLNKKTKLFIVPLGVAAHLIRWGIPEGKIIEHDWWESDNYADGLEITSTPARHFSGRGFMSGNSTLWTSWVIKSKSHKIFFGGDSGYFPGFKTIGEKYGPFDLVMLESGAYSKYWPYIHMMPEETVQAGIDLKGEILMPIHWGKFNLSIHPWTEPIERLLKEAKNKNVKVATPLIGDSFYIKAEIPQSKWWRL